MRQFCVLVVEDDPDLNAQVQQLLREAIPRLQVDAAFSVTEGIQVIDAADSSNRLYDLAILDFSLPVGPGEKDDVDESVCRHLMTTMPSTIVGHVTGFAKDEKVSAHSALYHPASRPRGYFIEKDWRFGEQLIRLTRAALYGVDIERQVRDLFPMGSNPRHPEGAGARSAAPRRIGSVSNRIMDLCLDIKFAWQYLDPFVRELVQDFVVVEKTTEGISVLPR